jgi:ElaB/YqjD/DUF883 family membrane-anchored ribosome-binding protein
MDQVKEQVKPLMGSDAARDAANRGQDAVTAAAKDAGERGQAEIAALREDLNSLKETVMKIISAATHNVASSASDVTSNLAGRVNNVAGELTEKGREAVSATTDHAKNLLDEFESLARRNPIGTLAAAVVVGIVIGMTGRRN